ncbi:MAG: hypothetical protein ACKO6F_06160 [Cyanobium sp.]
MRLFLLREPPHSGGFALPLAVMAGLVLMLGSLTAQTAVHQSRLRHSAALQQRRVEDRLASAAHHLVGLVAAGHACLLELSLEQWPSAADGCADGPAREALRNGTAAPVPYRLIQWRPLPPAGDEPGAAGSLELQLAEPQGPDGPPWRAAFLVELHQPSGPPPLGPPRVGPPLVGALRELGLRGVEP